MDSGELDLPLVSVCCPHCGSELDTDGLEPLEAIWMHEYECPAIALANDGWIDIH
jgi:hypothetical protein